MSHILSIPVRENYKLGMVLGVADDVELKTL